MSINLCVTLFKRHDLLAGCLQSAFAGTLVPDRLFVVDQARTHGLVDTLREFVPQNVLIAVVDLGAKRGCEASAVNWYLENVREERVIAHEDVVFDPTSLERFVAAKGDFLIDSSMGVITYRDKCINVAGLYDPEISPNYFRYVDVDYEDRLAFEGTHPVVVECGIQHLRDGTMKGYSPEAIGEYYHRADLARQNYEQKWGRQVTPGLNTIGRADWRKQNLAERSRGDAA